MATARKPSASLLRAEVLADADPEGLGRVKVQVPGLGPKAGLLWAEVMRPAVWPAGWPPPAPPAAGTVVLLAWVGPSPGQPVVVGALGPAPAGSGGQPVRLAFDGPVTLAAPVLNLEAGQIGLQAAMVKADNVLQCDTLISQHVIASSYTPGAGNLSCGRVRSGQVGPGRNEAAHRARPVLTCPSCPSGPRSG